MKKRNLKRLTNFLILSAVTVAVFFNCAFFSLSATDGNASQLPSWVRVTQEETWLYKNPSALASEKLFILAYSYYAKVLEETQNGFYYVELMENSSGFVKIYGYVLADQVTPQQEAPVAPTYPTLFVTVKDSTTILFSLPSSTSSSVCAVYEGQALYYFGTYPVGDNLWYFVRYAQSLCYVHSPCVTMPNLSLHPTPLPKEEIVTPETEPPATDQQPEIKEETNELSQLQIAIIAIVCLLSLVVVVILFLPAKPKKQNFYRDDSPQELTAQTSTSPTQSTPRYFDDYL